MEYKKYFDDIKCELLLCSNCKQSSVLFTEYIPIVDNRFEYSCKSCNRVSVFSKRLVDIEASIKLEEVFELDGVDKFTLHKGGFNWIYLNPDANCKTGQIIESSVCSQSVIEAVKEACNQTELSFNDFFWSWLHQEAVTYLYDNDGSDIFLGMYDILKHEPCDIGEKCDEDVIRHLVEHAENDFGERILKQNT